MMKISKILIAIPSLFLLFINSFGQLLPGDAIVQMSRGINIGNTMDCPSEGSWGNGLIKEYYFDDYKKAGFTNIRIPISWYGHTATSSPYAINATWMNRVEQVVDWGLKRGLIITINAHHESWLKNAYSIKTNRDRFDSIWSQIATRFKDKSDSLIFEIINEPHSDVANMTVSQVNELNARILSIIRKTNPERIVIFSGNDWSSVDRMMEAAIPLNDTNLIAYFHSYDPWPFGLQGTGSYSTDADVAATKSIFDKAANWSLVHNVPVVISEFGAIKTCDYNSRMYCYASVVEQALNHNIAFNAWDDGGDFLLYKRSQHSWNEIKDILIYTYNVSPTKLKISQPSNDSIILNWTNRTTDNDSIVVERKIDINSEFDTISIISPSVNTFIDTSIAPRTTYYYRLQTNIKDSITPMSYPISISLPYFTKYNHDTLVTDSFNIQLFKASDPDVADAITYIIKLVDGSNMPSWMSLDANKAILKTNAKTPVAGEYSMVLTAKDRSGQVAVDTFTLTMEVTISEISEQKFSNDFWVYPNPAGERITISWPLISGNIELSLVDYLGRTILTQKIEGVKYLTTYDLDISNVPSGIYILRINSDNSILCKKIYVNK